MRIISSTSVPDTTYFRVRDAEPVIREDGTIVIFNGAGHYRTSWGSPRVTSSIVVETPAFAAIHVGFRHKHGGGQLWRYFVGDADRPTPRRWQSLPNEQRLLVLTALPKRAPSWAHSPGGLRPAPAWRDPMPLTYTPPLLAYKIVEVQDGGRLFSLYEPDREYVLGRRSSNQARPNWRGGLYAQESSEQLLQRLARGALFPAPCVTTGKTLALIAVELSGRVLAYTYGDLAASYLLPREVVSVVQYGPVAALPGPERRGG